jgi:hypothetical protein
VLHENLLRAQRPPCQFGLGFSFKKSPRQSNEPLPETLQAASSMVCGWLLGADTQTFDCVHLTELHQTLPKFANLPVACRKRIVKLRISETFPDPKTAPQGIVILCDGEFLKETNFHQFPPRFAVGFQLLKIRLVSNAPC